MRHVYLDHAATTPIDPTVLSAMIPFLKTNFYNPSGLYSGGVKANKALQTARRDIAKIFGTESDTIYFTSGGTESNNAAILGIARSHESKGKHIVTTQIEHHAALEPLKHLESLGWSVTYLKTNKTGLVTAEQVISAVRPDTVLISIMYANNEIGTILPIHDIGRALLRYRKFNKTNYPYFFTDACQAAGYLDLHVESLHVDLLALNAGKIYGPKGSGLLYVRRGVKLEPLMFGGTQEKTLRPGTENVAGVVGLATALKLADKSKKQEIKKTTQLSTYFFAKLISQYPNIPISSISLNGPEIGERRLPNNINVTFQGIDAETLVLYLDQEGILCSTASACTVISSTPSHVLLALGLSHDAIRGTLRFTLGRSISKSDIDYTVKCVIRVLKLLK